MAKLQCRCSFINLRSGPTDTSWCSTWKHDPLQSGKHLAEESSWWKGAGDHRGHKAKCESPVCSHLNRACHILGYIRRTVARTLRKVIIYLCSALHPIFGFSSPRGAWRNWKESSGGLTEMTGDLEQCERGWGSCACLAWPRGGWGLLEQLPTDLRRVVMQTRVKLVFLVLEAVKGASSYKLRSGHEKTCSPGGQCNPETLPRKVVELLLLEVFQDLAGPWLTLSTVGDSLTSSWVLD